LFRKLKWDRLTTEMLGQLARDDRLDWFWLGDNMREPIAQLASLCDRSGGLIDGLTKENEKLTTEIWKSRQDLMLERSQSQTALADEQEGFVKTLEAERGKFEKTLAAEREAFEKRLETERTSSKAELAKIKEDTAGEKAPRTPRRRAKVRPDPGSALPDG
jgi:hypothetical protein